MGLELRWIRIVSVFVFSYCLLILDLSGSCQSRCLVDGKFGRINKVYISVVNPKVTGQHELNLSSYPFAKYFSDSLGCKACVIWYQVVDSQIVVWNSQANGEERKSGNFTDEGFPKLNEGDERNSFLANLSDFELPMESTHVTRLAF